MIVVCKCLLMVVVCVVECISKCGVSATNVIVMARKLQCSLQFCVKLVDIAGCKMRIRKIGIINLMVILITFLALFVQQIHVIIHPTIKKNTEKQTLSLSIRN